ncbi:MAG TPA: fdrA domain protein [Firmicutes bacterium]|nr:fdrA domain protein [Bacillota bacterium]
MSSPNDLFNQPLAVINIGLKIFAEALQAQAVPCVHVDWRPPAGGNPDLLAVLARLNS